ncbi:alpha-ketoglutarate dehydrogenase component 4 isoform X1 [Microplitis mediator]|uniref:alpha-ketoglutarate dehydrogenase component 4 isoform X1 n=1 Tax=Microplitis mediator TaxID=375433 RepID=UPI002552317B|nr:alpha-ketoglutarate dehydrogenase component 4 isoform X1 [Microplitis mediator]
MASRSWKVVQAHLPMIRFRKGGNKVTGVTATPSAGSGASVSSAKGAVTGPGVIRLPTIEDFQIPQRYQRRPIDDKEIAYINRGGPE